MTFVFPDIRYKDKATRYINEFYENDSEINGSGSLARYLKESTYEEWLKRVISSVDIANIPQGRVPSLTYFYVREEDDEIVGMVNLRLARNDFINDEVGHIGYAVRPTERGKHYATNMLKEALKVYDILGIREVILTCDKTNTASEKVILNCGGTLVSEFYSESFQQVIRKYVIIL